MGNCVHELNWATGLPLKYSIAFLGVGDGLEVYLGQKGNKIKFCSVSGGMDMSKNATGREREKEREREGAKR